MDDFRGCPHGNSDAIIVVPLCVYATNTVAFQLVFYSTSGNTHLQHLACFYLIANFLWLQVYLHTVLDE